MRAAAGALIIVLSSTPAFAQRVDLLCDGQFSDYQSDLRDVAVKGMVLRIDPAASVVDVIGAPLPTIMGRHSISSRDDYSIKFRSQSGFNGFINRWDGSFSVTNWTNTRLNWNLSGTCRVANRLF